MPAENSVHVKGGQGRDFKWKSDHAFVKVSSEDSGGSYSLIEDNLTTEFHLPKHLHREHSEAFYVVSGEVEFVLEDRTVLMGAGDSLYIPPNRPHEVFCKSPAKMLTLFQPAGIEKLFEAYAAMSEEDMANDAKRTAIEVAHDNIML